MRVKAELLDEADDDSVEVKGLAQNLSGQFQKLVDLVQNMSDELKIAAINLEEAPSKLADFIAFNLKISLADQQAVLESDNVRQRLEGLTILLNRELEVAETGSRIQNQVQTEMGKAQRDYYLREQMKAIQKELGEADEHSEERDDLGRKIAESGMPEDVRKDADRELTRLSRMSPSSPEFSIARTYLEWLSELPWSSSTTDRLDIGEASTILDEDHYGLETIKDRILEHLSVRKLRPEMKGPILCFVGPPGVGKTSLGRSVAKALGREFVRMSLGGVHDEAEIRGHRRTYIGALPGRIIQGIRKAGTNNPVFMLDEIDKLGSDFRGDPSSALLEVLDPEQNNSFADHYLDVPFDLSNVMFITTANVLSTIPGPLRDRMEVIELSGYTEEEKIEIAERHLIPKQVGDHGLTPEQIKFERTGVRTIVDQYTREAGLRNLEREIGKVTRKVARIVAEGGDSTFIISPEEVQKHLGSQKYHSEVSERTGEPGVAIGLAWTAVGGEIMFIEASKMNGKKGLTLTGQLGDVMKESAQAALTYIRSHALEWGIAADFFDDHDIHIHLPAGAIPKDGPSAGVTLTTVLASLLTGRSVRNDLAMTGEVTLRGKVLPVGGIKEKVLAAQRAGITTVVLPKRNERDLEDVPQSIKEKLCFFLVDNVEQVLKLALTQENAEESNEWMGDFEELMVTPARN
jgi:ATP-dependent Lon protease